MFAVIVWAGFVVGARVRLEPQVVRRSRRRHPALRSRASPPRSATSVESWWCPSCSHGRGGEERRRAEPRPWRLDRRVRQCVWECPLSNEWHGGRLGSFGMEEIRLTGGLTFWKAPHPAWKPSQEWPEEVGFATWESRDFYVFIDPLVRDDLDVTASERFDRAVAESGRPTAVLLTAPWHERSARHVAARYDARVWVHPNGRARVGAARIGSTAERRGSVRACGSG